MKKENFNHFRTKLLERIKIEFGLEPNDLDLHEAAIRSYYVLDWSIEKIIEYYEEKFNLDRLTNLWK